QHLNDVAAPRLDLLRRAVRGLGQTILTNIARRDERAIKRCAGVLRRLGAQITNQNATSSQRLTGSNVTCISHCLHPPLRVVADLTASPHRWPLLQKVRASPNRDAPRLKLCRELVPRGSRQRVGESLQPANLGHLTNPPPGVLGLVQREHPSPNPGAQLGGGEL